jgi:3-oxoacyl-[acyl-carrier protein] reductase
MDLGLKGKVAIITGGSRGIGRAIALGLAAEGCNVAICARGEEQLRATEAELKATGVRVHADSVDVAQAGSVEAFVDEVAKALGRVDVLVNNAGGARQGDDDDAWQGALDLNLMAAVRASRAAVAHMRKNGGGSIVNITSIWGREGGGPVTYNAVKAAMTSHAKNLALGPQGAAGPGRHGAVREAKHPLRALRDAGGGRECGCVPLLPGGELGDRRGSERRRGPIPV